MKRPGRKHHEKDHQKEAVTCRQTTCANGKLKGGATAQPDAGSVRPLAPGYHGHLLAGGQAAEAATAKRPQAAPLKNSIPVRLVMTISVLDFF